MKKATIVPLIVFIVLAGGIFYILSSFQINLFSGKIEKYDHFTLENTVVEHPYSLGDVVHGHATLDGSGWGLVLGAVVGFPLVIALLVRFRIKRKQKRRMAAAIAAQGSGARHETVA